MLSRPSQVECRNNTLTRATFFKISQGLSWLSIVLSWTAIRHRKETRTRLHQVTCNFTLQENGENRKNGRWMEEGRRKTAGCKQLTSFFQRNFHQPVPVNVFGIESKLLQWFCHYFINSGITCHRNNLVGISNAGHWREQEKTPSVKHFKGGKHTSIFQDKHE